MVAPAKPLEFLDNLENLPTLPTVAARVANAAQDETASVKEISDLIEKDFALSAKILQVVNSSLYGFTREIEHAPYHQHSACLFPVGAVSRVLTRRRSNVHTLEIISSTFDSGEPQAELDIDDRVESVSVGRIEVSVIRPGDRPVVAPIVS